MSKRVPPLTAEQKERLAILEPALQACVSTGRLGRAKSITADIQELLSPTGHETRLLQAKNWLYECAMESGKLTFAKTGFLGTRKIASSKTRVYLEATSLLGICYLREQDFDQAKRFIIEAVGNINNIKSRDRRKQFHNRLLSRLEEESILAGLADPSGKPLSIDKVDRETIKLVMSKSEIQILYELGRSLPKESIVALEQVRETYQNLLPGPDRKLLPPPLTEQKKDELGNRAHSALKRVAWRAICDPESELYKAWAQGLSVVYDKKYIAGAIVTSFGSFSISATMIAASVAALAIKFGAEVFCETFAPQSLMINKKDKS